MKRKRVVFCILVIIAVVLAGFGKWGFDRNEKPIEEKKEESVYVDIRDKDLKREVEWGLAEEGDHFYTINKDINDPSVIPSLYLVESHYEFQFRIPKEPGVETVERYRKKKSEIDRFTIDLYSIRTGEKVKTIDVNAILKRECPELQLDLKIFIMRAHQGDPCMTIYLEEPYDEMKHELDGGSLDVGSKRAYLNLETEELSIEDYSIKKWEEEWEAEPPEMWRASIFNDTPNSLLERNGIENGNVAILNYWEGAWVFSMPVTSLPEENKALYTLFPDLKEKAAKYKDQEWEDEDDIVYINVYLMNDPSQEEIMRLMLPDGQEISFEGVTISKYKSIDGEEHEVHSFEEYRQYQKRSENLLDESLIHPIFRNEP